MSVFLSLSLSNTNLAWRLDFSARVMWTEIWRQFTLSDFLRIFHAFKVKSSVVIIQNVETVLMFLE
jgi:hypothetical protein